jgi:hypothetical protein
MTKDGNTFSSLEEKLVHQVYEEERDAKFQHQGVCQAKALLG